MTNLIFIDELSGVFLIAAIILSIIIAMDMKTRPQSMKIMGWVWFLTVLWSSLLGFIAYFIFGREKKPENVPVKSAGNSDKMHSEAGVIGDDEADMTEMTSINSASKGSMKMDMSGMDMSEMKPEKDKPINTMDMPMMVMPMVKRPKWQSIALSAMHCGAGCTLADIVGESFTGFHPVAIGGSFLFGSWVVDYILALIIGVYFQYVAIREMQKISAGEALLRAVKADFLSLTAWQIGMYGWMAFAVFVLFKGEVLSKSSTDFWFMMQIAMLCGFLTAYPMNALLIKLGIKKGM